MLEVVGTRGGLLRTWWRTFGFHESRRIYWQSERLLAHVLYNYQLLKASALCRRRHRLSNYGDSVWWRRNVGLVWIESAWTKPLTPVPVSISHNCSALPRKAFNANWINIWSSHGGKYWNCGRPGYNTVQSHTQLPPCCLARYGVVWYPKRQCLWATVRGVICRIMYCVTRCNGVEQETRSLYEICSATLENSLWDCVMVFRLCRSLTLFHFVVVNYS